MKLIYNQPYIKNRNTKCWYGEPGKKVKKHCKYDIIKLQLPDDGGFIYITPDEAADFIRAASAGLHHFLVKHPMVKKIIKAKNI